MKFWDKSKTTAIDLVAEFRNLNFIKSAFNYCLSKFKTYPPNLAYNLG